MEGPLSACMVALDEAHPYCRAVESAYDERIRKQVGIADN